MGRYKRRPRIDEDDDNEVKPNQTPPTKRRRMLEPKSLHMPTMHLLLPFINQPTIPKARTNLEEMMSSTKEMSSSLAPSANTMIVFQTKTGDDGVTCSNSNCAVKFICNTDIGTILCNIENDIHLTFKAPNQLARCNIHNEVMKMSNVPKDFQPQEYIGTSCWNVPRT